METFTIVAIAGLVIGVAAFLYNRRKNKKPVVVSPPTPLPGSPPLIPPQPKAKPVAKYADKTKKQAK